MNEIATANDNASDVLRVLVVEDEPLVAENIRADLEDAGFEVVGVAVRLSAALRLIEEMEFDAAVLDANLAGASAVEAAVALSARKLPFIVLSGYAHEQLPREYAQASYLQKPYRVDDLIGRLKTLSAGREVRT